MKYTVVFVREAEGGYVVRVPALRGCVTEGDHLPEALDNAREAITAYLESLSKDGIAPPKDAGEISLYDDEEEALVLRLTVEEVAAVA